MQKISLESLRKPVQVEHQHSPIVYETSKQVKKAYKKRGGPNISEAEQKRLDRLRVLDERAEAIRKKEERKKQNALKRKLKEEKEGVQKKIAKITSSQPELSKFFKSNAPKAKEGEDKKNTIVKEDPEAADVIEYCDKEPDSDAEAEDAVNDIVDEKPIKAVNHLITSPQRKSVSPGVPLGETEEGNCSLNKQVLPISEMQVPVQPLSTGAVSNVAVKLEEALPRADHVAAGRPSSVSNSQRPVEAVAQNGFLDSGIGALSNPISPDCSNLPSERYDPAGFPQSSPPQLYRPPKVSSSIHTNNLQCVDEQYEELPPETTMHHSPRISAHSPTHPHMPPPSNPEARHVLSKSPTQAQPPITPQKSSNLFSDWDEDFLTPKTRAKLDQLEKEAEAAITRREEDERFTEMLREETDYNDFDDDYDLRDDLGFEYPQGATSPVAEMEHEGNDREVEYTASQAEYGMGLSDPAFDELDVGLEAIAEEGEVLPYSHNSSFGLKMDSSFLCRELEEDLRELEDL
ncbi:hypothetical protein ABW19_dt0204163 [Dactylella cylindrospora]|nr:hypothetical protein ABW19_dt0204163 [Dactylella cylindrospora]